MCVCLCVCVYVCVHLRLRARECEFVSILDSSRNTELHLGKVLYDKLCKYVFVSVGENPVCSKSVGFTIVALPHLYVM